MLVNTTNKQLDLAQSAVSLALLKAAGAINMGEVAVTRGGNLPYCLVFHTVLPQYNHRNEAVSVFR